MVPYRTKGYHRVTCGYMPFHAVPQGSLWLTVALCGSLGLFVAHVGSLWLTVALCGSLWLTLAHCGSLWLSVFFFRIFPSFFFMLLLGIFVPFRHEIRARAGGPSLGYVVLSFSFSVRKIFLKKAYYVDSLWFIRSPAVSSCFLKFFVGSYWLIGFPLAS